MSEEDENNFYRLVAFVVDVAPEVIREYFKKKVLNGDTFESYLNKHKHILYHLVFPSYCCECPSKGKPSNDKVLSNEQMKLLYDFISTNDCQNSKEKKKWKLNIRYFCICKYSARKNISVKDVLDTTLACCIMKNCETKNNSRDNWMWQIKNTRNKIVHKTDTKSISSVEFEAHWATLKGSVMGLASLLDKEYETDVCNQVEHLKSRQIINTDKIKEVQLLHEWWRDKLFEIEQAQQKNFNDLKKEFGTTTTSLETMNKELLNISQKTDVTTMTLDKILVHIKGNDTAKKILSSDSTDDPANTDTGRKTVPVVMYLDIPDTWDMGDVFEGVKKIQSTLNTWDSHLRIKAFSSEEETLFMDVAKYLMGRPAKFQKEVQNLLQGIVKESRVDTSIDSEMKVSIEIPTQEVLPTINISTTDYTVEFGTPVTIACTVNAEPGVIQIYWQKEDPNGEIKEIHCGTDGYDGSSPHTPSLTIRYPTKANTGQYTCIARNIVGTRSSPTMYLTVTGDIPKIVTPKRSYTTGYDSDVIIECIIKSQPALKQVYWEKRSVEGEITVINSSGGSVGHSLLIKNATMSDHGRYTCFAANIVGKISSCPILLNISKETLADIHFLLDTSGSIGEPGFEKQKQFIAKFAKSFTIGPMQFQIGVSNFGSKVHPQFYMNNYHHLPDLLRAINNLSYDGGGTNTHLALEWAGNNAFTKIAGIREQIDKILIVLTDGESSHKALTTQQASKLHRKGIKVFAIGIGNTYFNELQCIASDQQYVFTSPNFDNLIDILTDVTDTVKTVISDKGCTQTRKRPAE